MKSISVFSFFLVFLSSIFGVYAQSSNELYMDGNGSIIDTRIVNNQEWVIRKHNTQDVLVGYSFSVYGDFGDIGSKILFTIRNPEKIDTLEIAFVKNRNEQSRVWVKIRNQDNMIGWIKIEYNYDPYDNEIWAIIEKINVDGTLCTVRKLEQFVETGAKLNVREEPSLNGKVLFQLDPWLYINTLAILEETETIDEKKSHWVKITNNEKTGWVFGGYLTMERGGPVLLIPEEYINWFINLP